MSSDWVKTEAAEGASRRILVPVLLEGVKPPLEFRRLQAADLSDWYLSDRQAATPHPELAELLKAIDLTLGGTSKDKIRHVPMSQARESESPGESVQLQEGWYAELIKAGWASRKLRVHLTEEVHVVELTNSLTAEVVTADGTIKCKSVSLTKIKEHCEFEVSDGIARQPVVISYKVGLFGDVSRFRLSVAGRTLYSEEDA